MQQYKIFTTTLSINFNKIPNFKLNLHNIGNHLEIDDFISGIKFEYSGQSIFKGKYSTTMYNKSKNKKVEKINKKLFRNQITLRLFVNGSFVNAKLFLNGGVHLTGVKGDLNENCNYIIENLYKRILDLENKTVKIVVAKDNNEIFLDSEDNIYYVDQNGNSEMIGYKCKKTKYYYIFGKSYFFNSSKNVYISTYMHNKTQTVLNLKGETIGTVKIDLLKNKKKIFNNNEHLNIDYTNSVVYYQKNNQNFILGTINYSFDPNINQVLLENYNKNSVLEIDYKSKSIYTKTIVQECLNNYTMDINCINIHFDFNFLINRQKLYECILKRGYISEFNSEKYCGVKFIYKSNNNEGICICNNKCTCLNITFIIFQSGSVIASGFKSIDQINETVPVFCNVINEYKEEFKKSEIV